MVKRILIVLLVVVVIQSLHFLDLHKLDDQKIIQLKAKQTEIDGNIANIIGEITKVQTQFPAKSIDQQMMSVDKTISSSRPQSKKPLLTSFTMSLDSCKKIQQLDQTKISNPLQSSLSKIKEMRVIIDQISSKDQITQINDDLDKQELFANNLQKVIKQCKYKSELTQTVWQTNLYAKNWIRGQQTLEQIINQYYQRSISYDNVNNCPLSSPFFDGLKCIKCPDSNPVFNIFTKKCTKCQEDTDVDNQLKICVQKPHYTDYSIKDLNYAMEGATDFPKPIENGSPCNKLTPFLNAAGVCEKCQLPKYWSVKDNKCKECSKDKQYDINTHDCGLIVLNKLTVLDDTDWVTNDMNSTRVYSEQSKLLKLNQTSKSYSYCPMNTPYYDGIQCIICPAQFNIDEKKCSSAPNGLVYSKNRRGYVKKEQNLQSNNKAQRYISSSPLNDSPTPNCPTQTPFYDDISCLICLQPKSVFDVKKKRCVQCPPGTYINQKTHSCEDRPIFYTSTQQDNLLPTPKVSLAAYQQSIKDQIAKNSAYIVKSCPEKQFSNFTNCFQCIPPNQYFNLETKACDHITYVSNIRNANKLLESPTFTYAKLVDQESKIRASLKYKQCPDTTPYSKGTECVACLKQLPYFNIQTKECTKCPDGLRYVSEVRQCKDIKFLTDLKEKNILESGDSTIGNVDLIQKDISKNFIVIQCSSPKPYSNDEECISCDSKLPYFNLKSKQCQNCPQGMNYSQEKHQCIKFYKASNTAAIKDYIQTSDFKMSDLNKQIENAKKDGLVEVCPPQKPFSNSKECLVCKDQYFNLKSKQCQSCPVGMRYSDIKHQCLKVYKVSNTKIMTEYIETPDYKLTNLNTQIQNYKKDGLVDLCPPEKPFSNSKEQCIICKDQYFNIQSRQCQSCPTGQSYINSIHKCQFKIPITNFVKADQYIQSQGFTLKQIQQKSKLIAEDKKFTCPAQNPFSNSKSCVQCPKTLPYFNLKDQICVKCTDTQIYIQQSRKCQETTLVTNTVAAKDYIETQKYKIAQLNKQINLVPENLRKVCPQATPYSDGKTCLKCQGEQYFNLQSKKCEKCGEGTGYNSSQFKCKPLKPHYPNLLNNNWIINDKNPEKIFTQTKQLSKVPEAEICPIETPFYQKLKKQCLSCPNLQFYNYDTLKCQTCPSPTVFDKNIHSCINKIQNKYQTSLASPNLIYGGLSKQQYNDNYNQNKINKNYLDCPPQTPYYDDINCINCPSSFPYFNMNYKVCQLCQTGSTYNNISKQCMEKNGQTVKTAPNIAKMYANIF